MNIRIPNPSRKRALIIVDVQEYFANGGTLPIVPNIMSLIKNGGYEKFVCAEFHADRGSQWDRQAGWTFDPSPTVSEIKNILDPDKAIFVSKTSRSMFLADETLGSILHENGIEEIHIVGYDINDCVLTTANDAFDRGFFSYVIEECADSSNSLALREAALLILRENEMTNHSELIDEGKIVSV